MCHAGCVDRFLANGGQIAPWRLSVESEATSVEGHPPICLVNDPAHRDRGRALTRAGAFVYQTNWGVTFNGRCLTFNGQPPGGDLPPH